MRLNKDKLLTIVLLLISALASITIVIYLLWSSVYRIEPKTLSIINYYNFPVDIDFLTVSEKLEPFEVKNFTINTRDNFNIVTRKQDRTELSNIQITGLKLPEQLIEVVLSETKDYCYFNANVTNIYNSRSDTITNVNLLTKKPLDYFIFGINPNNISVYPGSPKPDPSKVQFSEVKGYYPIRCGLANNTDDIEKIVKVFIDYDHIKQIEFYNLKKEQVQNTLNLDELNNI